MLGAFLIDFFEILIIGIQVFHNVKTKYFAAQNNK